MLSGKETAYKVARGENSSLWGRCRGAGLMRRGGGGRLGVEEMRREKEQEGISRHGGAGSGKELLGRRRRRKARQVLGNTQLPLGSLLCAPGRWHLPSGAMSVAPGALHRGNSGRRNPSCLSSPSSPLPEPPACRRSSSRFFACSPLHLHLFLVCFIICRCNPAPCHPHRTAPPSACSPVPPARTPFPIPRSQHRT